MPSPAVELVKEVRARESSSTSAVGPFDKRRVDAAVQEICQHESVFDKTVANPFADVQDPYFASHCRFHRVSALRGKRAVLCYLKWRLDKLSDLWWTNQDEGKELVETVSPAESNFLAQYNDLMADYSRAFRIPIDLRAYNTRPPCSPPTERTEIRGLKTIDYISPQSEQAIRIYPGVQCSVSFVDAENLVRQGVAEYVSRR